MKNKLNLMYIFSAMFMSFGITGLDFENPNFEKNYIPYILLVVSLILFIYSIVIYRKTYKTKK